MKWFATSSSLATALSALLLHCPAHGHSLGLSVRDEILVKYRPGVAAAVIEEVHRSRGVQVLEVIPELGTYRLAVPATRGAADMAALYAADPACEYAEPNYMGRGGEFVPVDTSFTLQWHLRNEILPGADIHAVAGWQTSRGSDGIIVAILDSGIDSDHPEFAGRILPGFDFVNEDTDPEDDESHGTEVAGVLAANADNGFGVAGVDHGVRLLPVKVLDQFNLGTTFDLAQGLVFATNEAAHVASMSLINYPLSSTLIDALQFARDAGTILVACAGNGGIGDADLSGPGASPLTISVGATTFGDTRAGFSGTGSALDVVAPGSLLTTVTFGSALDRFSLFSGCSAATPIAAGIATLLLSLDPSLTHDEVRDILTRSADDQVGPPIEDNPGRDDFFGHGRVNLERALAEVAGLRVSIDIKPGSDPNFIDPRSMGALRVAILGSDPLNVAGIDLATLSFGPSGAAPAHGNVGLAVDVNDDGITDLVSRYRTQDTGIALGDTEACVTGQVDGVPFEGCDSISTVGQKCGQGYELALLVPMLIWRHGRRCRSISAITTTGC